MTNGDYVARFEEKSTGIHYMVPFSVSGVVPAKTSNTTTKVIPVSIGKAVVKLNNISLAYNKNNQTVKVSTVKLGSKTLKSGTDYTVSGTTAKKVGVYTVTITGKGGYTGTVTAKWQIIPQKVSKISKVKSSKKKQLTVQWKAQKNETTGYEIQIATDKNFKKNLKKVTITKNKTTKTTAKKLKSGKKYFVRIRTYKTVKVGGKSQKLYSSWTSTGKKSYKVK